MNYKSTILDEKDLERVVARLSHEIIEKNDDLKNLCLIGIKTRGVPLAKMIQCNIKKFNNIEVPLGILDINLYSDKLEDSGDVATVKGAEIDFDVAKKNVVVVDDVLYTGRTAKASLETIIDKGRPKTIKLCVLVDRGHRELPLKADFVGKNIPTSNNDIVSVSMLEIDGENSVKIYTV